MKTLSKEIRWPVSRINVVGVSGSGKSTFSRKLSHLLQHPYIEMDQIFWGPNWQWPNDEDFNTKLKLELEKPKWVLDGNYNRTVPIKWEKADMVIWLDYSFSRTLWQAIRRAAIRAWTQEEIWKGTGNRESFRKSFFSKESIIWWTITSFSKVRQKYLNALQDPKFAHIQFVQLRSHKEAEQFLDRLRQSTSV